MPQASLIRASFSNILLACQSQIVAVAGLPIERVIISSRNKVPHFQALQDVVLRGKSFGVSGPVINEAGLFDIRIRRKIEARCRTRLDLDETDKDTLRLTDPVYGEYAFEELIATTLMGNPDGTPFLPLDAHGNALCLPLILDDGDGPDPDPSPADSSDWIETKLHFWCEYSLASAAYPQ